MTKNDLLEYLNNARETSSVDFKREFYKSLKASDMPKDIAAFANTISDKDSVIIFGVEDDSRKTIGIDRETFPSQDDIDAYISQTIEPFVNVECGIIELDNGSNIGYICVLSNNINPPYIIKKTCGQNNRIEKGDIYIRKGSCNQKADRSDIDNMYINRGKQYVKIYENYAFIRPIDTLDAHPTYGRINIEIFNDSPRPIIINGGNVYITVDDYEIERQIVSVLPDNDMLSDNPMELAAYYRGVNTILFDFFSQDCVDFGFDSDGHMDRTVKLMVELYDTDGRKHSSDVVEAVLYARGPILHKVKQVNQENLSVLDKLRFHMNK